MTEQHPPDLAKLLPEFSPASRQRLAALLRSADFAGRIPADDAKALADAEHKDARALMLALLPLARTLSRPPVSNYLVGAVVRGVSGNLYLGANLEIPGQPLGFTVHAEQSAIANAYMHADQGVAAIAVTAAPCGHCRQFMNELSPVRDIEVYVQGHQPTTLSALLPASFGPKDLGGSGAFPIKPAKLATPAGADALATAAVDAARMSYAPYSKSPAGVAIATRSGRTYKGSYIENAAFNPSLPPLQTALLALIAGGEDHSAIARVTLAEADGAAITQRPIAEATLAAIAPGIAITVVKIPRRS